MFTTVNESSVSSRRSSLSSIHSISSTASSSRRSSVTFLSDYYQDADELALQECIETIDAENR
mgnify:CR=1 FL=1